MGDGVCDISVIEPSGSNGHLRLKPRKRAVEGLETAQTGHLKSREEAITQWPDDEDLSAVRAVAGNERGEPSPKTGISARPAYGEPRPVADTKADDFVAPDRHLDHVGTRECLAIRDCRHRCWFVPHVGGQILVFVIVRCTYSDEQVAQTSGLRFDFDVATGTRRLGPIVTAAAQSSCGKRGQDTRRERAGHDRP